MQFHNAFLSQNTAFSQVSKSPNHVLNNKPIFVMPKILGYSSDLIQMLSRVIHKHIISAFLPQVGRISKPTTLRAVKIHCIILNVNVSLCACPNP